MNMKKIGIEEYIFNTLHNYDEKSDIILLLFTTYFTYENYADDSIKVVVDIDFLIKSLNGTKKYNVVNFYNIKKYIHELGKIGVIDIHKSICIDGKFSYSIKREIMDIFKECIHLSLVS